MRKSITSKSIILLAALALLIASGTESLGQIPKTEPELLAILRSDAPKAQKALACKNLAVYGSSAAVADLAKLLADEQLASWARIPLEAIPGSASDEALRKAAESLEGKLLVGVLNSIGVRRDEGAVALLSGRLKDKDAEVASAAAVALGRIGNAAAAEPLRKELADAPAGVRSAVAEGLILCGERLLAAGNAAQATKIYDEVAKADVPRQRMLEATRGAILARGKEGIPLLVEQLRSDDKGLFQIALSTARELAGKEVDQALAAELDKAPPERAALVVLAMADRPETVDAAAVLKAAIGGPKPVRVVAIGALGRVGNASCLAPLLEIAVDSDAELSSAAKFALADLPGTTVDKEIADRLATADGKSRTLLIELIGRRQIDAAPALIAALKHTDRAVRRAALTALGDTASQKHFSVLVTQFVSAQSADDTELAQKALRTAAIRMPDREACATELATAADRSTGPTKTALLEVTAAVGGTKALATVGAAAKSPDETLQDVGSRLLGNWGSADAAPILLSLAKSDSKYQNRALRGYIGMSQKFTIPEAQRIEMCKNALDIAKQPAEKKLILEALRKYPKLESLMLAVQIMQVPELKKDASDAALEISKKLPQSAEVRAVLTKAGLNK
jgi:HEAT repeat protein